MCGLALWTLNGILFFALLGAQHTNSSPMIPSFPPPEPSHPALPIDQPPVRVHGDRQQRYDPAKVKKDAAELAKLAQSIPPGVDQVANGKLPKDLQARLKRIEKLSKQLRREIAR